MTIPQFPYRRPQAQPYTIEMYCRQGSRQPAPVKVLTNCLVYSEPANESGLWVRACHVGKNEDIAFLVMATIHLQYDGLWIYGIEDFDKGQQYYQVWALLPEPNQYSEAKDA